ncbi:MAG: TonB-dependent receptor [Sphingobacteriales bacterium]|nr:MAG: TonB-dependent receptor [Sphingobacteriales bacterium]
MAALSYRTKNNRWQGDINAHWFDQMRLPDTRSNPIEYRRPLYSTLYATLNIQATFRWKTLDIYAGCENLTNYRQSNPIIGSDNPFGKYFDLSSVWGPTRGRELYLGVRYSIK